MLMLATSLLITIAQLPGLYLRYIPFQTFISPSQKKWLFTAYLTWYILEFSIIYIYLHAYGIVFPLYKAVIMLGWIPYVIINIILIPQHIPHHIFIFGMQSIYTFLLHSVVLFIFSISFPKIEIVYLYYMQTIAYLILFYLTVSWIRSFFMRIFTSYHAMNNQTYWNWVCPLPFLICADMLYFAFDKDNVIIEQMPSRIILAITFFIFARCITLDLKEIENKVLINENNQRLSLQLEYLKEHTLMMSEGQEKMSILRHDIRHYNQILYSMIHDGKTDQALNFINTYDEKLIETTIHAFCKHPIVNAALSIYIAKAKNQNIPVNHKIDLPATLHVNDNEMAILLSNLLENAINASLKQPVDDREIRITVKNEKKHIVISIKNRFTGIVSFDREGLPLTHLKGHGLGMRSLSLFKKKYDATVFCTHEDGWFSILIYTAQNNKG